MEKLFNKFKNLLFDFDYFTNPKIRELICYKTNIYKILIDIACLFQNQLEFKSIFPHPEFQEKKCSIEFIIVKCLLV